MVGSVARRRWPLPLSRVISHLVSVRLVSCFLLLGILHVTRNYAIVLPSFFVLLVSGSNEVGSWKMPPFGSGRGAAPIFNRDRVTDSHLAVEAASTEIGRRLTEGVYAKANGLPPGEVEKRFAASGVLRCP